MMISPSNGYHIQMEGAVSFESASFHLVKICVLFIEYILAIHF
jgi:hypothetical protein